MIPPSFEYHRPATVEEAVGLLSSLGSEAKILAGGHSLLPMMKLRFAMPEHLVDINRISELSGVSVVGDDVTIGAMTTENAVIADPILNEKVPLLPEAAKLIADPQVRNRGTIGGDIAHGDPANDHPALALACDAVMTVVGPDGARQVPASEFFLGTYWTALNDDDILTAITVKAFPDGAGFSYRKLEAQKQVIGPQPHVQLLLLCQAARLIKNAAEKAHPDHGVMLNIKRRPDGRAMGQTN